MYKYEHLVAEACQQTYRMHDHEKAAFDPLCAKVDRGEVLDDDERAVMDEILNRLGL